MEIFEKYTKLISSFFDTKIDEHNFSEVVFKIFSELFEYSEAYVLWINSDSFAIKYAYSNRFSNENLSNAEFNKLFKNSNVMCEDLYIEKIPFAKLLLILKNAPTGSEKLVFASIASIIANLLKNIELNEILKMQVEALQEGMQEINEAYKIIKEQNKKILASEKVKNEFLASVSHQLRSPLNSIIGFSDMLSQEFVGKLNPQQSDYVNDIKISSVKLLGMINEILDISRLQANSVSLFKRKFNLLQNIVEVCNILKPLYLKKNISMNISVPESCEVEADYQKLQQVFFNLISNAIKFTPVDGEISVSSFLSKGCINISVKDNGIGIALEDQKKIFKKFVQLSSQDEPSTGLGLTIVKELVKLHRGKVVVKSDGISGAEFVVSLPVS